MAWETLLFYFTVKYEKWIRNSTALFIHLLATKTKEAGEREIVKDFIKPKEMKEVEKKTETNIQQRNILSVEEICKNIVLSI